MQLSCAIITLHIFWAKPGLTERWRHLTYSNEPNCLNHSLHHGSSPNGGDTARIVERSEGKERTKKRRNEERIDNPLHPPGMGQFFLGESQFPLYPHMRAKFGRGPTFVSDKGSFKFISRLVAILNFHVNIPPS